MLQSVLQGIYDFLMRPIFPFEVRLWAYAALFFFMLLPYLLVVRSAWQKRSGGLDK